MYSKEEIANLMFKHRENSSKFKKSETVNFETALELCKKYIAKNSKKSSATKIGVEAKRESERMVDDFVNQYNSVVEGFENDLDKLRKELKNEIINYQAITELMEDEEVGEIRINDHKTIFYEKKGNIYRWHKTFKNPEELEKVLSKLIGDNSRLSASRPFINSKTLEGYRVNATDKSISPNGDNYTAVIRKFKKAEDKMQLVDIIGLGSLSDNMAKLLQILPRARFSFVTVGGTGSGKTVTNEILISGIPIKDRCVYIENPPELTPHKYNEKGEVINDFIQMYATVQDGPNATENDPTPNNLVENALRQTPNWIILGEARSDREFAVMLKAAQTGHNIITTYHAKDPADAIRRYLVAYMAVSKSVPAELALQNICEAFRFIINVEKLDDGSRKVMYITEVIGSEGLKPILNDIYRYEIEKVTDDGEIIGRHVRVGKLSERSIKQLRKSSVPDSHYEIYTTEPSEDEEETYNGLTIEQLKNS